jgi:hypothetical protein
MSATRVTAVSHMRHVTTQGPRAPVGQHRPQLPKHDVVRLCLPREGVEQFRHAPFPRPGGMGDTKEPPPLELSSKGKKVLVSRKPAPGSSPFELSSKGSVHVSSRGVMPHFPHWRSWVVALSKTHAGAKGLTTPVCGKAGDCLCMHPDSMAVSQK